MSAPKPHIKPKANPYHAQTERGGRDSPPPAEYDPPVFTERDPRTEQELGERVLFHEDESLR